MTETSARRSPPIALAEALSVAALIQAYIWLFRGRGPAVAGIIAVVLLSHWKRGETPAALGFTRAGFARAMRVYLPIALVLAALISGGAIARAGLHAPRASALVEVAAIFLGYSAWGLVQQWGLNGYFTNRFLVALGPVRHGRSTAALLAALCFGAAHASQPWLAIPATLLGWLSALAYLRHRNLYALALAHGIVGTALVVSLRGLRP